MARKITKTTCSRIADHYYNTQTRYKEGCGNHLVIIEIEKLCEQGKLKVSREELIHIVTTAHPERKNLKDRVIRVVRTAKTKNLLEEKDGIITIKTC